jgi:ProP effector
MKALGVGVAEDRREASTRAGIPTTEIAKTCKPAARRRDVAATLELLSERWPNCFQIYERRRWPLKIGIHHDILAALEGAVTPAELGLALKVYTANRVYRARLVAGATRINLSGEPCGVVTPEQVPQNVDRKPQPVNKKPETPSRLSLADLKQAALQRKAGAS